MTKEEYAAIERHMLACMKDGAHDKQHVYRVLFAALDIAADCVVDRDVLIAACLLHDIGRDAQFKDPRLDHARVGADMAFEYLSAQGWPEAKAGHVRACVRTHRYRNDDEPESLEAKILFDADKLDVAGALGIARTLAYKGIVAEPLYSVDEAGRVLDGTGDAAPSFFQEYNWKLKNIYGKFYTAKAARLAEGRRQASVDFYESMYAEVEETQVAGLRLLSEVLN
jgi:uncharacterized domain HDIG